MTTSSWLDYFLRIVIGSSLLLSVKDLDRLWRYMMVLAYALGRLLRRTGGGKFIAILRPISATVGMIMAIQIGRPWPAVADGHHDTGVRQGGRTAQEHPVVHPDPGRPRDARGAGAAAHVLPARGLRDRAILDRIAALRLEQRV
jgi:hypothetical protein